ncbi:MAG: PQQ-binding-like beta-propeller repeat protein, partial [Actinomycetia bacterium]|nr:PQQ-binding-like beta-propeller repeat protein [Actinomycetes bacterium]
VVAAVALVVTGGILVFNRTTADAPPAPAGQPAGQAPEGNGGVPPPAAVGNLTTINWSATFGDAGDNWFAGVALAPDGARIAVGYTSDAPAADGDMYGVHRNAAIAAYAADGSLWWSKTLGGRGHDEFTDVAVRSDGTIVAVGYTDSTDGDFTQNGNVLTSSGVVAAFSPEGTVLWSRTLGPGENYVTAVAFTDDGSIVVAGGFNAFLVKLSPTGTPVWDRTYSGSGQSAFNGLALAPNGDIVVAGSTQSADGDFPAKNVSADPNIRDALVARLDADGNPLWRQVQGGSGGDEFSAVAIGPDGTVVAAGFGFGRDGDFTPGTGPGDYFCAALSSFAPDGTPLWAHGFGGPGMSGFWSVVIWPDGRIIAGGNTNISSGDFAIRHDSSDEALLARVSADGRLQDYGTWGGSVAVSDLKDLVFVPSGEIVAVGYTSATDGDFPAAQSAYAALVVDFASLP